MNDPNIIIEALNRIADTIQVAGLVIAAILVGFLFFLLSKR